jgi:hypothetical protein
MPVVTDLELLWREINGYGHFGLAPLKNEGIPVYYDHHSQNTLRIAGVRDISSEVPTLMRPYLDDDSPSFDGSGFARAGLHDLGGT